MQYSTIQAGSYMEAIEGEPHEVTRTESMTQFSPMTDRTRPENRWFGLVQRPPKIVTSFTSKDRLPWTNAPEVVPLEPSNPRRISALGER